MDFLKKNSGISNPNIIDQHQKIPKFGRFLVKFVIVDFLEMFLIFFWNLPNLGIFWCLSIIFVLEIPEFFLKIPKNLFSYNKSYNGPPFESQNMAKSTITNFTKNLPNLGIF